MNAIRYDAYGQTIATGSAGGTSVAADVWKYQARLDVSPAGLSTPLYDMSARFYNPGIGAFTQLDSVMGGAGNPLSMNRFLYALANPATLIDPSGHYACEAYCGESSPHASELRHERTVAAKAGKDRERWNGIRVSQTGGVATPRRVLNVDHDSHWVGPYPQSPANYERAYTQWLQDQGIDPSSGCRPWDFLCSIGSGLDNARPIVGVAIGLVPGVGDLYQAATINSGYDPIADVHFTREDQETAAVLALGTGGLGFSGAYLSREAAGVRAADDLLRLGPAELRAIVEGEAQAAANRGVASIDAGLTDAQRTAATAKPWLWSVYRGTYIHNETYARLAARFGPLVQYSSNKGPDFTFFGQIEIELTTTGSLATHQDRYPSLPKDQFATYHWVP